MAAIELGTPRIISIEERGKKYLLTLSRITRAQWLRYFEGIISTSENQSGKRVDYFDSTTARVDLVESVLVDAKGYGTADGAPVNQKTGWQQLIPLRHRQAAGIVLTEVERADPLGDEPIMLGSEPVYLNAVWGANDSGEMQKLTGLCHRFKTPSSDQQRKFSRDSSRSVIVGGSRRGVTKWLGAQAMLAQLYDELIDGVEGYTVNGEALGSDRDRIVAEMDTYHKVAAADVLFSPGSANVVDEAK
jgi:hypothetical protein